MRTYLLSFILLILCFACKSPQETPKEETTDVTIVDGRTLYEVYKPSEMSTLMKSMYAYNEQVKADIIAGRIPEEFPEEFMTIHTAELSNNKTHNERFDAMSSNFIESQRLVFEAEASKSLKDRHNDAINMCITCHKSECTGPIPKIKKLLIQ